MFTGLIEEVGTVARLEGSSRGARLTIRCSTVLEGARTGDSIAVNGVCLTVTGHTSGSFTADVMAESLRRSGLGALRPGDPVNLERAMPANGRFGGHIVSGHIDGTGTIESFTPEGDAAVWVTIAAPPALLRYLVEKGSITIDGISLTVAYVDAHRFRVSIIPHTGAETTLLRRSPGDTVNLECDIIAKYVEKLMQPAASPQSSNITLEFLAQNGF